MERRSQLSFAGGAAICSALPAFAQTQRVKRVGRLLIPPATHPNFLDSEKWCTEGMKRMGWDVGRNLMVAAPARFSTSTCCPTILGNSAARTRATRSVPPPAL